MLIRFRPARHRAPIAAALAVVSGVLVLAGCGSSGDPSTTGKSASSAANDGLSYADCMRSHGVPNFPDPTVTSSGGQVHIGIKIGAGSGVNPSSPSFQSAQKACGKLLPGGGPTGSKPSAATETQMLATAQCMRAHGISGFPDPTTSPPTNPAGYSAILMHNGVAFAIPNTIDVRSPAFQQAASSCHFGGPPGGGAGGAPASGS